MRTMKLVFHYSERAPTPNVWIDPPRSAIGVHSLVRLLLSFRFVHIGHVLIAAKLRGKLLGTTGMRTGEYLGRLLWVLISGMVS